MAFGNFPLAFALLIGFIVAYYYVGFILVTHYAEVASKKFKILFNKYKLMMAIVSGIIALLIGAGSSVFLIGLDETLNWVFGGFGAAVFAFIGAAFWFWFYSNVLNKKKKE